MTSTPGPTDTSGWTSPADLAEQAHAALAQLARQTLWEGDALGYSEPADVYATVSALSQAVHALPQVLDQAATWLQREGQAGRIGYDGDGTDQDLPLTLAYLAHALGHVAYLTTVLDHATGHTAHLTSITTATDSTDSPDALDTGDHDA